VNEALGKKVNDYELMKKEKKMATTLENKVK
jgi:hypothetical protein